MKRFFEFSMKVKNQPKAFASCGPKKRKGPVLSTVVVCVGVCVEASIATFWISNLRRRRFLSTSKTCLVLISSTNMRRAHRLEEPARFTLSEQRQTAIVLRRVRRMMASSKLQGGSEVIEKLKHISQSMCLWLLFFFAPSISQCGCVLEGPV